MGHKAPARRGVRGARREAGIKAYAALLSRCDRLGERIGAPIRGPVPPRGGRVSSGRSRPAPTLLAYVGCPGKWTFRAASPSAFEYFLRTQRGILAGRCARSQSVRCSGTVGRAGDKSASDIRPTSQLPKITSFLAHLTDVQVHQMFHGTTQKVKRCDRLQCPTVSY